MRLLLSRICVAACLLCSLPAHAMTPEERRAYLEKLQATLPDAPAFREWLQKTGELPPDFDALPRMNPLPDPLQFLRWASRAHGGGMEGPPRRNSAAFREVRPGHVPAEAETGRAR